MALFDDYEGTPGGGGGGLLGRIFGGGGGGSTLDLYGDLFSPEQKKALEQREMTQGLFRMAEKLGALAQPSRAPPGLGGTLGALGAGLGAFGGGTGEEAALKGMQTAEAVRKSKQERAFAAQFMPLLQGLYAKEQQLGLPQGTLTSLVPTAAASGTPGPPGAPGPSSNAPPPPPGAPPTPSTSDVGAAGEYGAGQALPALTPPPGYENDINRFLSQPSAGQQNTGLLPPPPGARDEVVGPDGRPLPQGVLPQLAAMYGGGGPAPLPFRLAAAIQTPGAVGGPSDAEWLRQNAPFPTLGRIGPQPPAAGGAYTQGYTYGEPKVPLGQSPEDVAPRGGPLGPADETARRPVAGPLDLIEKYESGGRNIKQQVIGPEGGYNPSVGRVTGPSSASGYYQMTDPTWRAAAGKAGVDTEKYPTAMSAPKEVQRQVAQTLFDEEGYKPWAPYNSRLAAAVGYQGGGRDTVIPSGPRLQRGDIMNVADTGGGAAPAGQSGLVPGLNTTPQGLAILNSMAKLSGLGDPFNSLLETYYKSPGYIAEKARTEAEATKGVELRMDPLILEQKKRAEYKVDMELKPRLEEAVQKLQSPILKERAQAQADIDRITNEMKQAGDAALRPNDATIIGPGGVLTTQKLTDLEFAKRQQARAERAAKGDTAFQPGDIVGTPVGAAPAEHQYIMTPQGTLSAVPVPGTPAAEKAAETANKKLQGEQQRLIGRDVVVAEVANIKNEMATASLPTTGLIGSWLQNTGDTAANNIRVARQTIESRMSTDAINAMRAASPTGAALGNASDADLLVLRTAIANLDQSQGKAQFLQRLDRVQKLYIEAVHGPGASRLLPETPVLKTPGGTTAPGEGPASAARAGAADAIAKGAPRDAVLKRLQDAGISTEGL